MEDAIHAAAVKMCESLEDHKDEIEDLNFTLKSIREVLSEIAGHLNTLVQLQLHNQ
jgi:archaellum component FlaC